MFKITIHTQPIKCSQPKLITVFPINSLIVRTFEIHTAMAAAITAVIRSHTRSILIYAFHFAPQRY